jgi:glycosyltransferase involved in cell wall biosynthesis
MSQTGNLTKAQRLLVVVPDRLSLLIEKGEVTERYYNPGGLFGEVHLLLTNDDQPDPAVVQRLAGDARVFVHNLPAKGVLTRTLGWRPALLRHWAAGAVMLARQIRPDLVRCYGADLNGMCALEIRRALCVPVVVSLHTLPGDPANPPPANLRERVEDAAIRSVRRKVLREADLVLAVYATLVPYLERLGARRVELAYNVLNGAALRPKEDYALHTPVRVISVGRQIPGKDPRNLIRAVAARPDVDLTLVGSGSIAGEVTRLVDELDVRHRVVLRPAVANDELVAALAEHDLFAVHCDYLGVPKAVLEPMLAGLPVLLNRGAHGPVPELHEGVCLLVENSPEGYGAGLDRLIGDKALREQLGRAARRWAEETCEPSQAERRVVGLYNELLAGRPNTN